MSADIFILPIVRVDRDTDDAPNSTVLRVTLKKADFSRLEKLAREWNLTDVEAAEMLLSEAIMGRCCR